MRLAHATFSAGPLRLSGREEDRGVLLVGNLALADPAARMAGMHTGQDSFSMGLVEILEPHDRAYFTAETRKFSKLMGLLN